jgi:adenosylcobinamide-phosphate synthase
MMMMLSEDLLIALLGAIVIDLLFGDPSNNYHPVAWLGGLIGFFAPKLKDNGSSCTKKERFRGIIFSISLIIAFGIIIHIGAFSAVHLLGSLGLIIFSVLILKITIAIRGMEKHAKVIMSALERRDLINARYNLSMIVRRDTKNLDDQHVISGTIECIGESVVDGITSPLFYYSLFGPAGAFVYRIINTLDSMIGYNDNYYKDIGWMSATLDTIGNYIPARITAFLMVIVARILGADSEQSMQILKRDHNKTMSPNAGYPMATMAGALRIKLEKVGYYSIGEGYEPSTIGKCKTAISIMKLTAILFSTVFSFPLITILYLAGWWRILFGL